VRLWVKALVLALLCAAPASAGELTSRSLPGACDEDTDQVIAFACDPAHRASAPVLTLGTKSGQRLEGAEALQPGETVTLTWSHPSPRSVLFLNVASPTVGTHGVIVNLRQSAERVVVTVGDGGSLTVTPGGVVPAAERARVAWGPRTPRAAARLVLHAVRHMERSVLAVQTLCASLPGGVRDYYTFGSPSDDEQCLGSMALFIHGDENVPGVVSTHAAGLRLKVDGSRAVMRTRLVHRYRPQSPGEKRRIAVNARALLVRDSTGVWWLATPETMFPLTAVVHRRAFRDSELREVYRFSARRGRRWTGHNARIKRQATARLVPSPCSVSAVADPPGDVSVETVEPARDQARHSGGDLLAAGFDGRCLTLRTVGPLPAAFSVVIDSAHPNIRVANGVVEVYDGDQADELKPIRGATAHLDANGLTVLLPRSAQVDDLELDVDVNDVRYGDTVPLP
jgi:hypothetical protein